MTVSIAKIIYGGAAYEKQPPFEEFKRNVSGLFSDSIQDLIDVFGLCKMLCRSYDDQRAGSCLNVAIFLQEIGQVNAFNCKIL